MPTTVKSLEDRIDGMATDVEELTRQSTVTNAKLDLVSTQLATVVSNENATQTQLAVVIAKFDGLIDQLRATNARVDSVVVKLDDMTTDYAAHKSKSDTTFALTKWVGAFVAGVFLTVLVGAFTVMRSAGNLESTVQQQQKSLDEIKRDLGELRVKPRSVLPE